MDSVGEVSGWISILSPSLLLRATIVLGVAWAVTFLLRKGAASHRHIVWTAGLLAASALPLLSGKLPEVRVPVPGQVSEMFGPSLPQTHPARGSTSGPERARVGRALIDQIGDEHRRSADPVAEPEGASTGSGLRSNNRPGSFVYGIPLKRVCIWIWLAGTGLVIAFWIRERWIWHRLRLVATPATSDAIVRAAAEAAQTVGLDRDFEVLISDDVDLPVTWGTLLPVVLLPAEVSSWPARRLRSVLAHELAHIRRHDHLARHIAAASVAIYWFHPLAWLAARRARIESEAACDDEVVLSGMDRFDYAEDLVVLARGFGDGTIPRYAATAARSHSQLRTRIHELLDSGKRRDTLRPLHVGVPALSATAVACLLTVLEPAPRGAAAVASAEPSPGVPAERIVDRESPPDRRGAPFGPPLPGDSECWRPDRTANHNSNRNEEDGRWVLAWKSTGCQSRISVTGPLVASSGFERLVRLAPGGGMEIVEHEGGKDRVLRVWADHEGSPVLTLRIGGRPVERLAAPHRAWLRDRLAFLHDETDGSAVRVEP